MFEILQNNNTNNKSGPILLTLSTCFYILKSKFPVRQYIEWINNFLLIVKNFNLVIYTEHASWKYISHLINLNDPRIKVVFKPLTQFKLYKYQNEWIKNHNESKLDLHQNVDWELNMLWNEKVFFVEDTVKNAYFKTFYYGWCDIGYFRNNLDNIHTKYLHNWPNLVTLLKEPFTNNVIHYAVVQENYELYNNELLHIKRHYEEKLLDQPSSDLLKNFFAGGFFILKHQMIQTYAKIYEAKLEYYFNNNYIIKDDQTIITDIIATNQNIFCIHDILKSRFNEWFAFQKILM